MKMLDFKSSRFVCSRFGDDLFISNELHRQIRHRMSIWTDHDPLDMGQALRLGNVQLGKAPSAGEKQKDRCTQKTAEPEAPLFLNGDISAHEDGHPFHSSIMFRKSLKR